MPVKVERLEPKVSVLARPTGFETAETAETIIAQMARTCLAGPIVVGKITVDSARSLIRKLIVADLDYFFLGGVSVSLLYQGVSRMFVQHLGQILASFGLGVLVQDPRRFPRLETFGVVIPPMKEDSRLIFEQQARSAKARVRQSAKIQSSSLITSYLLPAMVEQPVAVNASLSQWRSLFRFVIERSPIKEIEDNLRVTLPLLQKLSPTCFEDFAVSDSVPPRLVWLPKTLECRKAINEANVTLIETEPGQEISLTHNSYIAFLHVFECLSPLCSMMKEKTRELRRRTKA